jgi:hypothetical protein
MSQIPVKTKEHGVSFKGFWENHIIIPRFFDEKSCLKLVFATLICVSQRWQRIRMTSFELAQIDKLRRELGLLPPMKDEKSSRSRQRVQKAA